MDKSTLLGYGFIAAIAIMGCSSLNWRRSLKCVFVLLLLEGAIRKWILPSASDLVYFAKDVVLAGVYLGALCDRKLRTRDRLPPLPWPLIQMCLMILFLGPLNPNIGSPICALLGIRGYLFYLPIAFLVPHLFRSREELTKQLAFYLMLALPICLLGFLQFRSDRFSMINTYASGVGKHGAAGFGVGGSDLARITGTFSYLSGHVVFVCVFFGVNIALLFRKDIPFRFYLSVVSLPLLVANAFMSGSRAALAAQGLIAIGFAMTTGFTHVRAIRRRLTTLVGIAVVCAVAAVAFFPDAVEASLYRVQHASDSVASRLYVQPLYALEIAWEHGGTLGTGMGGTNPSVIALRNRFNIPTPLEDPGGYDFEPASIVAEIGVIGACAWYLLRVILFLAVVHIYFVEKNPEAKSLALAAILIIGPFFLMSLVLNHVACVLLWGVTGLAFSNKLPSGELSESSLTAATVRRRLAPAALPRAILTNDSESSRS